MPTITLNESDAGYLWHVLEELLNDGQQSTYVKYGKAKHWKKSAYVGKRTMQALVKVHNQLMGPS